VPGAIAAAGGPPGRTGPDGGAPGRTGALGGATEIRWPGLTLGTTGRGAGAGRMRAAPPDGAEDGGGARREK
jgi:hypothetical protein